MEWKIFHGKHHVTIENCYVSLTFHTFSKTVKEQSILQFLNEVKTELTYFIYYDNNISWSPNNPNDILISPISDNDDICINHITIDVETLKNALTIFIENYQTSP